MNETPDRVQKYAWTDRPAKSGKDALKPTKPADDKTVYKKTADPPKPVTSAKLDEERQKPKAEKKTPKATPAASPRDQGRVIAQVVMGSFVERLKSEAQRKGGALTLSDIEGLDHEFEQKTAELETLFEKSFEEYARMFGVPGPEERRGQPFDRLVVETFEKMFAGGNGPPIEKGGISRRILPGFFMAVNMMIGPEAVAGLRARAESVFNRINDGRADNLDWNPFLEHPETKDLRLDTLIAMAVHFANPDKRARWLLDLINNHLAPASRDPETDPAWSLSRISYDRMIDALFSSLMAAVADPKAREAITKRYGPETCASVANIMKGLGA